MPPSPLPRLRKLCLTFPEAHEVEAWGEPTFRVKNKMFVTYAAPNNHHGAGRHAIWCKSTLQNQQLMVRADPSRYFVPPYVGVKGWIGMWIDKGVDWNDVKVVIEDSYRLVAPKRLLPKIAP